MRTNRLMRLFGRRSQREAGGGIDPHGNVGGVSGPYLQWYERDPDLYELECRRLSLDGMDADGRRLPDGRMAFTRTVSGAEIVVLCSYQHPLEPPSVLVLDGEVPGDLVSTEGTFDLFSDDNFRWCPNTGVAGVVDRVAALLEVENALPQAELPFDPTSPEEVEVLPPDESGPPAVEQEND